MNLNVAQWFKKKPVRGQVVDTGISFDYPTYNPDEIVGRKGIAAYKKMRYDDQVKACLFIKKAMILSVGWQVTGSEQPVVDFVKSNLESLSFKKVLRGFLSAFEFGFSASELIWDYQKGVKGAPLMLTAIKTIDPELIDSFQYNRTADLDKVIVSGISYPADKFFVFSYNEEFGNRFGVSDLQAAYTPWFLKDVVWKFLARYLEKFGSPLIKGSVPRTASDAEIKEFEALLQNIINATEITIPKSSTGDEFDISFLESQRTGGSQFVETIDSADARIARAFMLPRLFGYTKETFGSYALGKKQIEIFTKVITEAACQLEESINNQIISKLVGYNFQTDEAPKFSFNPISPEEVKDMINLFLESADKGVVKPTEQDENHIRSLISFPNGASVDGTQNKSSA